MEAAESCSSFPRVFRWRLGGHASPDLLQFGGVGQGAWSWGEGCADPFPLSFPLFGMLLTTW